MVPQVIGHQVAVLDMMKALFDLTAALLIIENGIRSDAPEAGKEDLFAESRPLGCHCAGFAPHAEHVAPAVMSDFEIAVPKLPRRAHLMSLQVRTHLRLNLQGGFFGNGLKEGLASFITRFI